MRPPSRIVVSAPSHVHAGNIDLHGGLGRLYGTAGFALEEPRLVVEASRAEGGVEAEGPRSSEAERYARRALEAWGCDEGVRLRISSEIPAHVGLGSTTALALSSGYAALALCGVRGVSVERLAEVLGRGVPSALGVYSFKLGGFLVDGGFRRGSRRVPPLVFRAHVPRDVAVVVALPEKPVPRIMEIKRREAEVLASMPPMPEDLAARAARLLLVAALPAAAEGDWAEAARALHEFNRLLGEYWAEAQGSVYCCRESEELIDAAVRAGAWGALQSSWGPTVYALAPARRERQVLDALSRELERLGGGRAWSTRVDNEGARATVEV